MNDLTIQTEKGTPLLAVVGPTASGKTALAVALAKRLGGEVVSADSMQVYQRMQIATAKPTEEEMQGIPHHLLDFLPPDAAAFSVANYAKRAHAVIAEIAERGRLPILCGGTGLYINAVVDNLDYSKITSDSAVRQTFAEQAAREGNASMLEHLRAVDPTLAESLHPNNLGRILRALEVHTITGIPMSEHQRRSRLLPSRYALCMLGIDYSERQMLYDRVNLRVDRMLEAGLLEEAQEICQSYSGTAAQAIGYKELQPFLDGDLPLADCVASLKQASRRYAKRQLSWFRRDERIQWLIADRFSCTQALVDAAEKVVHKAAIL